MRRAECNAARSAQSFNGARCRQFGRDFGNVPADLGHLVFAASRDHVPGECLGSEHRGAQKMDFGRCSGPFTAIQSLESEIDEQAIGRRITPVSLGFDAFPLLVGDPDLLLQCAGHWLFRCRLRKFRAIISSTVEKIQ